MAPFTLLTNLCAFAHDPFVAVIIFLGTVGFAVFLIRWGADSKTRRRERGSVIQQPRKYLTPSGRDESFLGEEQVGVLPSVAFIMPVKWASIKAASPVDNWRSQVLTAYQGKHESIFVVESEDDGAVKVLRELQEELKEEASIRIVVAGLSKMCTQKIHNMVAGVDAVSSDTQYVLFLDANGHMHPGSLGVMMLEMMKDDQLFATSGIPFDIPQPGATVWAWTMCQFRSMVLSMITSGSGLVPWGGAMLMRKWEIDNDVCEIKTRWINGGYSDDLLVGQAAMDHGRKIGMPVRAIFPNTLKRDITFAQSWDFLRRQVFTLSTFGSRPHCFSGTFLLGLFAIGLPFLPVALLLSFATLMSAGACATTEMSLQALVSLNVALSVVSMAVFSYTMILQRRSLRSCWELAGSLSPDVQLTDLHLPCWTQFASFIMFNLLAPFLVLSLIRRSCEWGGITYHVSDGKVVNVERPQAQVNAHHSKSPAVPAAETELKTAAATNAS